MAKSDAGEEATAMNFDTTFTVSLLRCKKTGKVLFLEAGKDFVDTLISFLLLPVGTILHMLSNANAPGKGKPVGGISSMYTSVGNLDSSLLHVDRKHLVEPRPAAIGTGGATGLLKGLEAPKSSSSSKLIVPLLPTVYYRCDSQTCKTLSTTSGTRCEMCSRSGYGYRHSHTTAMTVLDADLETLAGQIMRTLSYPDNDATVRPTGQGFVKESITYLVTDSLEIMPSTTIRSIKVLNKLKVATLADLESKDVFVDITQVLQLLRSALTSSTCLNEVFGLK